MESVSFSSDHTSYDCCIYQYNQYQQHQQYQLYQHCQQYQLNQHYQQPQPQPQLQYPQHPQHQLPQQPQQLQQLQQFQQFQQPQQFQQFQLPQQFQQFQQEPQQEPQQPQYVPQQPQQPQYAPQQPQQPQYAPQQQQHYQQQQQQQQQLLFQHLTSSTMTTTVITNDGNRYDLEAVSITNGVANSAATILNNQENVNTVYVNEAPREFYKLYNQWSYKAEFLSLDMCRYYRFNNSMEKVDWCRSIRIIMKAFNDENTDRNNFDNAYKVKNFLEILPVANLLNKRNPELYQSGRCIRCNYTIETWTHIWICNKADTSIIQIINAAFEILKAKLDEKDFRIHYNYHARLLRILNEKPRVVFNGRIFHEAIKGIVNERLFLEMEDKFFKDAIASFVEDIHDMARKFMWSERCKSFNEWEIKQGITKQMKKTAKSIWYEIGVEDLWKYNSLVTFRSSNYASNFSILD
ncbi:hypothetical protein GLOIN_2v1788404 [Rhizophagus irregularis DAOM 181602=DAOM 197198]|uniref:Uncharacterized protein n=2 Tax=Rhizophagus irregularis (strain DAOM 181602 / DAOM 197198 / MUCL 43194) TaxID=747089 RepID=A0A2P4P3Q6_RHIID|nr:hypothetical protein GLOIN_2v1788404 [Rhizophagus irregularis DAOM 181602=DAOM 197198]POG60026.1 hypothetical protein GLOIN_2v1788404 [Rhizophagus irregularis DAOM 181602=DAOM 197198]|eukprot:XP_025166892.1 hypothetical protein GLOIN_2v1788404 [Rhizophagus irregularis DAOM 181602=DAOM 197198]